MKRKNILLMFAVLTATVTAHAQSVEQELREAPYTRHWVDSANRATLEQLRTGPINAVNWFVYEGQEETQPQPSLIINFVRVKLEDECLPVEEEK